jgi:hypothetical protein
MKKLPKKSKQWAKEAYGALDIAWGLLQEKHLHPDDGQKLLLLEFAPPIAAVNRGISDKARVEKASDFAFDNFKIDFENREMDEPVKYSICFLLAYLDCHVSFGIITEAKAQDVMHYLMNNYDVNDGGKVEETKPFIFH